MWEGSKCCCIYGHTDDERMTVDIFKWEHDLLEGERTVDWTF